MPYERIVIASEPAGNRGIDEAAVTHATDFAYRPVASLLAIRPPDILTEVPSKMPRDVRLRHLVDNYIHLVARILRNAGTAEADIDDDVQRVFIAMSNRLIDVRVGAEKSFLVQTALNMAAHSRRAAARRRETLTERPPEVSDFAAGPEELAERRQVRRTLDQILGAMDVDLRAVFVLFELEEMTTTEIASILEIPTGTVASRLRRARTDFRERLATLDGLPKTEVG
jgi:RNA polymerase sigma-70 factor (ECF subfamily)